MQLCEMLVRLDIETMLWEFGWELSVFETKIFDIGIPAVSSTTWGALSLLVPNRATCGAMQKPE